MKGRDAATVDLTRMRLGARAPTGGKIEVCPTCGRKGAAAHYEGGGHLYRHVAINRGWAYEVTDSCYVSSNGGESLPITNASHHVRTR